MNFLLLRSFVSSKPISGLIIKTHERYLVNMRIFVTVIDIYFAGQNMIFFYIFNNKQMYVLEKVIYGLTTTSHIY